MPFQRVADVRDIWDGEMLGLAVDGRKILLVHCGGALRAYEDRCAHQSVALSEGRLENGVLTCRAHEWQYDACAGTGINPRAARLCAYPVRVEDGAIWVELP